MARCELDVETINVPKGTRFLPYVKLTQNPTGIVLYALVNVNETSTVQRRIHIKESREPFDVRGLRYLGSCAGYHVFEGY